MTYINLLFIFIITILFIWGLYATTREGMIFERMGKLATDSFGEFYSKPFTNCPTCMSSIYGSLAYFVFIADYSNIAFILYWVVWCFALAGANQLISLIVYKGND